MDQPKIERILRLMQLLSGNVNYGINELVERLEISPRTLYRYLDTFKSVGFAVKKMNFGNKVYRLVTVKKPALNLSKIVYFSDEEAYVVNKLIDSLDNTNTMKQELKRKLTAVYDITNINNYFLENKSNSYNIDNLSTAMSEKRRVRLKNYSSSNSGITKDYYVEPHKFTTNYLDIWAYDVVACMNKRFKIQRIKDVEILKDPWTFEEKHKVKEMDSFRIHGDLLVPIKLRLDNKAKNLLIEEYPLAEKEIYLENNVWFWEGKVRGFQGIGRFVLSLFDSIDIIQGEELKEIIREKAHALLKKVEER